MNTDSNVEQIKNIIKELISHETSEEGKLDLLTSISIGCENDEIFQASEAVRNDLPLSSDQIFENQQAFSMEIGFTHGEKTSDVLHESNGHENFSSNALEAGITFA